MGITYLGPIPGHDISMLCRAFREAKKVEGPVLLHVLTQKGKGYAPAEKDPSRFHGTGPFDISTGEPLQKASKDTYTDIFSKVICDIGKHDPNVAVITAAMADGTGLSAFARYFPKRFFDVGIAEGHGVTFAAGAGSRSMHRYLQYIPPFCRGGTTS